MPGKSTIRATLRLMSSSRPARVSAALRIWRIRCTLRTEWPSANLRFRKCWTLATDSRRKLVMTEAGLEIEPGNALVQGIGGGAPGWLDDVLQPVIQVGSELPRFGGNRDAAHTLDCSTMSRSRACSQVLP